jgi:hypothetical protein
LLRAEPADSECTHVPNRHDKAAYWVPALYTSPGEQEIDRIQPEVMLVYYRNAGLDPELVQPFPQNLRMIAGNAHPDEPTNPGRFEWSCVRDKDYQLHEENFGQTIPETCRHEVWSDPNEPDPRWSLRLRVYFPACWNGSDNYLDHTAHMRDSLPIAFPPSSTIAQTCDGVGDPGHLNWTPIPQLQVGVRWPLEDQGLEIDGNHLVLDPLHLATYVDDDDDVHGNTAHADFMSGWTNDDIEALIDKCYHDESRGAPQNCGTIGD